ncbi:MAG: GTP-binding protein [Cyanobacteria bacterium J06639_1]
MNFRLRQAAPLLLVAGSLVCLHSTTKSIATLHAAVAPYSPGLANGLSTLLALGMVGVLGTAGWWWTSLHGGEHPRSRRPKRPLKATRARIETTLAKAEGAIAKLHDDTIQRSLAERVETQRAIATSETLRLVLFGTSSAGKTSTVNALLGHQAGETAATLGTTQHAKPHTYTLPGFNGTIELVDTPGLQTVGAIGEGEAIQMATEADLLVFVVAEDLDAVEYALLQTFSEQGKRAVIALNKSDCRLPDDNQMILDRLRAKTRSWLPAEQVVEIAAAPTPILVREMSTDGSAVETEVARVPEVRSLTEQCGSILQREGQQLRLAAAMVRAQNLAAAVDEAIAKERRERAERVVQRMQWATAGAVAATPLPALDLVAAAAINARTISELHEIYEREISWKQAQKMAKVAGKLLLKLGGVELASQAAVASLKFAFSSGVPM